MKTNEFDYDLPDELIAQSPAVPRESCRLLVLHRSNDSIEHTIFSDILLYLNPGDLLVVNDTKVMPARLLGTKDPGSTPVELLLLRPRPEYDGKSNTFSQHWQALVKPGRRLKPGSRVNFEHLQAEICDWVELDSKGQRIVRLETEAPLSVSEALQKQGTLPLPPYIKGYTNDPSLYQTVYAREQNSAAAPTAGLHFSQSLLQEAEAMGCRIERVCLEIGLDTFRKVEEEDIADHRIHSEFYSVSTRTVEAVEETKKRGGRVIAVGTTAVRALESAADWSNYTPAKLDTKDPLIQAQEAPEPQDQEASEHSLLQRPLLRTVEREQTQLYITPGYEFKVVDALLTNFHTPRSTLLMLVSAFCSHKALFNAYEEAKSLQYRFLSFGDAMFID